MHSIQSRRLDISSLNFEIMMEINGPILSFPFTVWHSVPDLCPFSTRALEAYETKRNILGKMFRTLFKPGPWN